jgi:cell division protein FtsB
MKPGVFRAGRAFLLLTAAVFLFFGLRVPQEIAELRARNEKIRRMQKENADLAAVIAEKKRHNRELRNNHDQQELEIRRQLRYQREGETSIILPDQTPAK